MIARKLLVVSRTASLVRDMQAAAGPGYIVVHHNQVGDVEEFVDLKGPFDVLVAGPVFDSRTGMERLRRLRETSPELPLVLALPTPPRASLPDIVRSGAADLVEMPAERRHMAAAIRRALESVPVPEPESDPAGSSEYLGEVISVASPSGGCGKTFYSTNLAYFLARQSGRRVCLVDLDLQFGEVVAALRLRPAYTMVDAIVGEEEGADIESHVEDYLVTHESGFWVLAAPRHPAEADRVSVGDVSRIVSALRSRFDYVVIDTSAQLSEVTLAALEQSTALVCMATVDVPSIRNMRVFLETMERLHVPTDRVSVVLNKVENDIGIEVEDVNEALFGKVVSSLPYAKEVSRSINHGRPVMAAEARSEISRKLAASMHGRVEAAGGMGLLAGAGDRAAAAATAGSGSRRGRKLFSVFARSGEAR